VLWSIYSSSGCVLRQGLDALQVLEVAQMASRFGMDALVSAAAERLEAFSESDECEGLGDTLEPKDIIR